MFIRCRTIGLVLATLATMSPSHSKESSLRFKTFDGRQQELTAGPTFVITSHSQNDIEEALRCASLVESIPKANWIIDVAWPQPAATKRIAAQSVLKSDYLKAHSTILPKPFPLAVRIALVDTSANILWSSPSFPSASSWKQAREIVVGPQ